MPTIRIPLVGSFNQRGIAGSAALVLNEDQRFLNCTFNVVQNPVTGKAAVYAEKRPGWGADSTVSSGIASTGLIKPQLFSSPLSAFGETNSAVYVGQIHVGNITGRALHFTETLISASSHVLIKSSDGTGWYYTDGAKDVLSYTGHTSSGTATVSTIADTTGLYAGQLITGGQIGAAARVSTVNFGTSTITLTVNSTATSTGALLTKEPIAKILSANFLTTGTHISAFVPMDGYHFYATDDGNINNSNLNSFLAYAATGRLAVQQSPDAAVGVAKQKNAIVVMGLGSKEIFQNAGLATGSPLLPVAQLAENVGAINQRSMTQIEDDIYFVGSPSEGDVGVYRLRALAATRISTPTVDRIIGTAAVNGAIYASSFRMGGYAYALFSISVAADAPDADLLLETGDAVLLESADRTLLEDAAGQTASFVRQLAYNIGLNIWSEWDANQATFIDSIGSGTNNQLLATSRFNTAGKIYRIDPASDGQLFQDDGSAFTMAIRTSKVDLGTSKTKIIDEITLVCDEQSSGAAQISWSDDDYQTSSTPRTFDLSQEQPRITRCGSHRGSRSYTITHSSNAMFRAEAIEITYRIGRS